MLDDHEVVPVALLIPQKQILAVNGVDPRPVLFGLLGRRDRWMLVARERDAQRGEVGSHLLFLRRHGWRRGTRPATTFGVDKTAEDLKVRTKRFAVAVLEFAETLPRIV